MKNSTNSSLLRCILKNVLVLPAALTLTIIPMTIVRLYAQGTSLSLQSAALLAGTGVIAIVASVLAGIVYAGSLKRKPALFEHRQAGYGDADRLREQNEKRKAFLDALSSELRDPLVRIMGLADGLISGAQGSLKQNQVEDVRIIHQACSRLNNMVAEVQDLSSLMMDGIDYDEEPVNLEEEARKVIEEARADLRKKGLKILMQKGGEPPLVRGNRRRLGQVMANLVANGVKNTSEGQVSLRLDRTGDGLALIEVSDTGVGIPAENLGDVFDPFRQPGDKSKRMKGYGLGLAICKRLVELHKGEIKASSSEGRGSCFTAILWSRP